MSIEEEPSEKPDFIDVLLAKRYIQKFAEQVFEELDKMDRKIRSCNARISNLKRRVEEEGLEEEWNEEGRRREPLHQDEGSDVELHELRPGQQLDPDFFRRRQ